MQERRFSALRQAGWGTARIMNTVQHIPESLLTQIDQAKTSNEAVRLLNDALAESKATVEEPKEE